MTGGRIILPPTNPSLDSNGNPVSGSTLTYYQNGTTTPVSIYSDKALTVPLANPLTSDSAGVFPQVWASNAAGYSVKWMRTGFSDVTFNDIFPDLDSSAVGTYVSLNQSQVSLGTNVTTAFGTVGVGLIENAFTQTDSTTGAGTVATAYASTFGAVTFATPANAITITNAYGLYLKDPVAGAHVTLTNKWALGVDSLKVNGPILITGHATIEGVTSTGATGTGNLVFSAAPAFTGTVTGVNAIWSTQVAINTTLGGSATNAEFAVKSGQAAQPAIEAYNNASTGEAFRARVDNTNSPLLNLFFATTNTGSISTTSTNAAYNTSSDARLKKNIQDTAAADAWAIVSGLRVRSWDWIVNDSHEALGFVAQEEHQVAPFAVTAGDDNPDEIATQWQRDDSKLVPALVKVVQDLLARIAALEAKP